MQKSMRYHIADGENQPVVRAVTLVVRPDTTEPQQSIERSERERLENNAPRARSRWIRPTLRRAPHPSS